MRKFSFQVDRIFGRLLEGKSNYRDYVLEAGKLYREIQPLALEVLLTHSEAFTRSANKTDTAYAAGELLRETVALFPLDNELFIKGRDLLKFGFKPGKELGLIIKEIEKQRNLGNLWHKQDAVEYLKRHYL